MWIIFSEWFHCQTGTYKIEFSPVLLRPARRIPLRSIWGGALRDVAKGMIAERTYIMYVERLPGYPTIAAYIAWRADQVLYGSYPLDIYSNDNGLCVFAQDRTVGGEP